MKLKLVRNLVQVDVDLAPVCLLRPILLKDSGQTGAQLAVGGHGLNQWEQRIRSGDQYYPSIQVTW